MMRAFEFMRPWPAAVFGTGTKADNAGLVDTVDTPRKKAHPANQQEDDNPAPDGRDDGHAGEGH
jgi:hypothetical protein